MSGVPSRNPKPKRNQSATVSFDITVGDNWFVDRRLPGVKWMLVTGTNEELLLNPSLCYQFIGQVDELEPPHLQFMASYFYAISKDSSANIVDTRENELKRLLMRPVTQNEGHLVNGETPIRKLDWPHVKQINVRATINVFAFDYVDPSPSPPALSFGQSWLYFLCTSACFSRLWFAYSKCIGVRRKRLTLDDMV